MSDRAGESAILNSVDPRILRKRPCPSRELINFSALTSLRSWRAALRVSRLIPRFSPRIRCARGSWRAQWSAAWTVDFFAPPREDFLLGGKPAYISEGEASGNAGPIW